MSLSKKERKALAQNEAAPSQPSSPIVPQKSNVLKYSLWGALGVIVLLIAIATISYFSPGYYDDFASCLKDKGAVMYGAMGWCEYTQGQKAMFGKSFRHLSYEEFGEYPVEQYGPIKKTPTWIIDGKIYENAQSLQDLSKATGCPLP